MFSPRPDGWWLNAFNRVYLWSGALAALSGLIAIFATRGIQVYSERIDGAQKRHIVEMELQTAQAKLDASKALESQAGLESEVAKSGLQQERLRKLNLELQSKVENERLARLQIEQKLAPRSLNANQLAAVAKQFRLFARQRVDFFLYPNDPESLRIANQIGGALHSAGLTIVAFHPMGGGDVSGMRMEYDPRKVDAKSVAQALVASMTSFGLAIQGPIPSLPTPQNELPAYLGPDGQEPIAAARLTIGTK